VFEKMLKWIRQIIRSLLREDPEAAVSDIMMSAEMEQGLALWSKMYTDNAPWVDGKNVHSLGLAAAIASEYARLVTLEMDAGLTGSPRAAYLDVPFQELISKRLREQVEYGCAKGSMVFKPYVQNGSIAIDCVQADMFYPLSFDSSKRLTGAIFSERITRSGRIYTRLEAHRFLEDGTYLITNQAHMSKSDSALGAQIELTDVPEWADIDPEVSVSGLERPLFAYFRQPSANNIDCDSPMGISVFARAADLIREADRQYSRFLWEFEGGELAIDAAADVVRATPDGQLSLPKGKERLFRKLDTGDPDFYKEFAPALRDTSLLNGLNAILRRIEFNCALAYGTLSDVQSTDKTAEEIRASKQRSYSSVSDTQKALEAALRDLVYAMDVLATAYNLAPAGIIDFRFEWDDSIVADRPTEFAERMQLQTAGRLRPEINIAWYFGVDEAEALGMMTPDTPDPLAAFSGMTDTLPVAAGDDGEGGEPSSAGSRRSLNGAQTQSLIAIIAQLSAGQITEGQAVNLIATSIGIDKAEAIAIVKGEY